MLERNVAGLRPAFLLQVLQSRFAETETDFQAKCVAAKRTEATASRSGDVRGVHQRELLELAHAAGSLGAEQMALAGMHTQNFAVGGDLEALFGAAVGLQLYFGFDRFLGIS